jgi:hypothetical protein
MVTSSHAASDKYRSGKSPKKDSEVHSLSGGWDEIIALVTKVGIPFEHVASRDMFLVFFLIHHQELRSVEREDASIILSLKINHRTTPRAPFDKLQYLAYKPHS